MRKIIFLFVFVLTLAFSVPGHADETVPDAGPASLAGEPVLPVPAVKVNPTVKSDEFAKIKKYAKEARIAKNVSRAYVEKAKTSMQGSEAFAVESKAAEQGAKGSAVIAIAAEKGSKASEKEAKAAAEATESALDKAMTWGGIGILLLLILGGVGILLAFRTGKKVESIPIETVSMIQRRAWIPFKVMINGETRHGRYFADLTPKGEFIVWRKRPDGSRQYYTKKTAASRSLSGDIEIAVSDEASPQRVAVVEAINSDRLEGFKF